MFPKKVSYVGNFYIYKQLTLREQSCFRLQTQMISAKSTYSPQIGTQRFDYHDLESSGEFENWLSHVKDI